MVEPIKKNLWKCPDCDMLYEHQNDAIYCCPYKEVEKVESFECSECGEMSEDKNEIEECCK